MFLLGYIGLSLFTAQFIAWAVILGSALYVLLKLVDDLSTSLFTQRSRLGTTLVRGLGVRGSVVDQFGLLLSGIVRLALIVVALVLLVTPFGDGGGIGALFGRLGTFSQGVEVGGVSVSPGTIFAASLS